MLNNNIRTAIQKKIKMSYYSRGGGNNNTNHYGSSKSKRIFWNTIFEIHEIFLIDSYGNNNRSNNGNNLLDDLDSFDVGPLRPGPPIIKNFYSESSLITNRPQVRTVDVHLTD